MQTVEKMSLDFYDAVIANDGKMVLEILNDKIKLPVKTITGMLIIAVEGKAIESIKAILLYNQNSSNQIKADHLNSILYLAAKLGLLHELGITYH